MGSKTEDRYFLMMEALKGVLPHTYLTGSRVQGYAGAMVEQFDSLNDDQFSLLLMYIEERGRCSQYTDLPNSFLLAKKARQIVSVSEHKAIFITNHNIGSCLIPFELFKTYNGTQYKAKMTRGEYAVYAPSDMPMAEVERCLIEYIYDGTQFFDEINPEEVISG